MFGGFFHINGFPQGRQRQAQSNITPGLLQFFSVNKHAKLFSCAVALSPLSPRTSGSRVWRHWPTATRANLTGSFFLDVFQRNPPEVGAQANFVTPPRFVSQKVFPS